MMGHRGANRRSNKKHTFHQDIQRTFLKYTIGAILAVLIFYFAFSSVFYLTDLNRTLKKDNRTVLTFLENTAQVAFKQMPEHLDGLGGLLHEYLASDSETKQAEILNRINQVMHDIRRQSELKFNFLILDRSGQIVATNLFQADQQRFSLHHGSGLQTILPDDSQAMLLSRSGPSVTADRQGLFYLSVPLRAQQNQVIGELVIEPLAAQLLDTRDNLAAELLITDRFDNVLFSSRESMIDTLGKSRWAEQAGSFPPHYRSKTATLAWGDDLLEIRSYADISVYIGSLQAGLFLLILLGTCLIIFAVLISRRISKKLTRPLHELNVAFEEGPRSVSAYQITAETYAEFQTLYDAYNEMAREIQSLLERNLELVEVKRSMEIKNLEAKFSPHFLFNTLETLRYEIDFNPANAVRMMERLARLLRYSINYGLSEVSLETDMAYIDAYLQLQKMRFDERLNYHIDVEPGLGGTIIPKLLIQPLVENAIVHAIDCVAELMIDISIKMQDGCLVIVVKDNGPGIPQDILGVLTDQTDSHHPEINFGLRNVYRTVALRYGGRGTVDFFSRGGTEVVIRLPLTEE